MSHNEWDRVDTLTPTTAALQAELAAGTMRPEMTMTLTPTRAIEVRAGSDSLWVVLRENDRNLFALRAGYAPGIPLAVSCESLDPHSAEFRVQSSLGMYRVYFHASQRDDDTMRVRSTVRLTPSVDLALPYMPRDFYPLGQEGTPKEAVGKVHAAQRGVNSGLLFLTFSEPEAGTLLYFQNLTALNPYFEATQSKPDGCVGGTWPELGYQPPVSCPDTSLKAGVEVTLSDVFLEFSPESPTEPPSIARLFLDQLARIYADLERTKTEYRDWIGKSRATLRDLENAPDASIMAYGHKYLHPYTASEYPDSMVQLTVLMAVRENAQWAGQEFPLVHDLRAGMGRFYDKKLGTIRRYLPNVGDDKNADEVDAWYLYHPLANLGRLAREGDKEAREMFLNSLDFGIKVAHHFQYDWPVQFDIETFEVIKDKRKPGDPGQSDVGGLYAYVCLAAYDLTGYKYYIQEAEHAMFALRHRLFSLLYQTNITAWGAIAALHLWRITGNSFYKEQSYVFLATFFHNTVLWESEIDSARHYSVFMGATCLHDGPYMAIYECYESFAAFYEYLEMADEDLPDSVRLLMTESYKYALSRAWYFYPNELPEKVLATEVRNGAIDRNLAFPLEDLYADGQPAGQVGQEIYGAGAAFALTTRAYRRIPEASFLLFAEYPIFNLSPVTDGDGMQRLSFQLRGVNGFECKVRLIPREQTEVPPVQVTCDNEKVKVHRFKDGSQGFTATPGTLITMTWKPAQADK